MNIFKIKQKKDNKKSNVMLLIFLSLCFMFVTWSYANMLFEPLAPLHLQYVVLSMFVFITSIITIMEGIYKTSSLLFNCKDDDLLLSLPINKKTIIFIRIFKFYIFELMFNTLFILPMIIAYLRWADTIDITFFITSFVMIFMLPIIPIVISCIIGAIISSLSSRFKYKNLTQIVTSTIFIILILILSFNMDNILEYLVKNATSINDLITKIYYPAGLYASLSISFNLLDLIIFILINIIILTILIFILSKFYFKINTRLKSITTSKKTSINKLTFKSNTVTNSLIKKELNIFFKTPVFIINAGFGLVLFILASIVISFKFDSVLPLLTDSNTINLQESFITNNISIFIFILVLLTSFMTSITNSLISLEGKNINILKSLPISTKKILMSKIYACLVLTTPVLLIGNIILFIRFKISIIESILLLILSILIPLVSHFIGLIINLKYPKLDFENSAEVVKQSTSSFLSVMLGMILVVINIFIIFKIVNIISSTLILLIFIIIYIIIDTILYLYLTNISIKEFNKLSI